MTYSLEDEMLKVGLEIIRYRSGTENENFGSKDTEENHVYSLKYAVF